MGPPLKIQIDTQNGLFFWKRDTFSKALFSVSMLIFRGFWVSVEVATERFVSVVGHLGP